MPNSNPPSLASRLYSVWFRHVLVYSRHLISNGFPPFMEPLVFLVGIGLGLGRYITAMNGIPYLEYLASGLLVTSSMYTASFECTFGTFIRLEFNKSYDGMLGAPITVHDLIIGEILWAATKGAFFTFAVLCIVLITGIIPISTSLLTPLVGFVTGAMFGTIGLVVTSFVKTINHFSFYLTGILSPMFFFSGVVFPIEHLPPFLHPLAEVLPLTHAVRLVRALCDTASAAPSTLALDLLYCLVLTVIAGYFAIRRLEKRLIQ
ncbi:ABC transporter [candidate division KSB3 bacterium]|uniref:Transport permease protein n=1 Tax=candidate division KSB3 bacterium TaxID=2044937 RepID=A0A9D5JX61_9BACT|nr:ABC transporter [candidate division KSB3 bacterium]MBD3325773.1 ABC transporter [candidate division KSB3 bacterium]